MEGQQKPDPRIEAIFKKLGLPLWFLKHKTAHCPHNGSCVENIIKTSAKSFKYGFVLRGIIALVGCLLQFKGGNRNPKILIQALIGKDNWAFGGFLALFPLINKSLLCWLRNHRNKNCGVQDFVTGAIAGSVSVSILPASLRFILTLYLFTRALESIYRHFLIKNGKTVGKWDYVLLFSICCGFIGYAFSFEPDLMPPSLVKIYLRFANMDQNDMIFRDAWIEMGKKKLAGK